jgi:hypothetical protein
MTEPTVGRFAEQSGAEISPVTALASEGVAEDVTSTLELSIDLNILKPFLFHEIPTNYNTNAD